MIGEIKWGTVVQINGIITTYKGAKQLGISSIRSMGDIQGLDITEYLESSPIDIQELRDDIQQAMMNMTNPSEPEPERT